MFKKIWLEFVSFFAWLFKGKPRRLVNDIKEAESIPADAPLFVPPAPEKSVWDEVKEERARVANIGNALKKINMDKRNFPIDVPVLTVSEEAGGVVGGLKMVPPYKVVKPTPVEHSWGSSWDRTKEAQEKEGFSFPEPKRKKAVADKPKPKKKKVSVPKRKPAKTRKIIDGEFVPPLKKKVGGKKKVAPKKVK